MYKYCADDFINNTVDPVKVAVEKKMGLLLDFRILEPNDHRAYRVRKILSSYNSEYEITRAIHDVIVGRITIDTFLAQKEMIQ